MGYDQLGWNGILDPYGSLSPTGFELGGIEHSIIELRVGGAINPTETGKLFLTFDKALPDGAEFTLTLGTAEFTSSDGSTFFGGAYRWASGAPTWSDGEEVAVELDFTAAVAFREGTTLEEIGAFTTPTMPPTLAFEAEMTMGVSDTFDGYDSADPNTPIGSILHWEHVRCGWRPIHRRYCRFCYG